MDTKTWIQILEEAVSIGCLNIHGTHMTANNSTTTNVVLFFLFQIWK